MARMETERKLVEIVRSYSGCLFHVTDEGNFPSIEQHDLLSKDEAAEKAVFPVFPGGSDLTRYLDGEYGLNDFVFLGFTRSGLKPAHRSERRRRCPRVLLIDPEVLLIPGVKIALGCANHYRTRSYRVARAFYEMDLEAYWEVYFGEYDEADMYMRQRRRWFHDYEVLVSKCVPINYIVGVE